MKRLLSIFLVFFLSITIFAHEPAADRTIFEIRVYHFTSSEQETTIDQFLKDAYLPALHRQGVKTVGVFKAVTNDTAKDKKIYLLIPYKSLKDFEKIGDDLKKDKTLAQAGTAYIDAPYNKPVYTRFERIVTRAFEGMPGLGKPELTGPKSERIYELRSYEGHTEKINQNKVQMFNKGDEIGIFKRLGFNAVFYAEVLAGSTMPNLMYMTSFNNRQDRDERWKQFNNDPAFKALVADPIYQHNVSKNVTIFLHPAEYSEL